MVSGCDVDRINGLRQETAATAAAAPTVAVVVIMANSKRKKRKLKKETGKNIVDFLLSIIAR